jgi:hypothetical protein
MRSSLEELLMQLQARQNSKLSLNYSHFNFIRSSRLRIFLNCAVNNFYIRLKFEHYD